MSENQFQIDVSLESLDFAVEGFFKKIFGSKILKPDRTNIDVIFATQDRWVQIQRQKGNNINFPSIVLKRAPSIRPSTEMFLFKHDRTAHELYRKINPEETKKTGNTVLDIATIKSPTYIAVNYDIILFSRLLVESNIFQQIICYDLQREVGVIRDNKMFFDIFMDGEIDDSNLSDFADDEKKIIVGYTFRLEGFFIDNDSVTITQTAPRTKMDVYEGEIWDTSIFDVEKLSIQPKEKTKSTTNTNYSSGDTIYGERNTASNLGTTADGLGIYSDKVGVNLQLKRLKAGTGILLTSETNAIEISVTSNDNGITTLNSLTSIIQGFETSNTGNDFSISSSLTSHIFSLPYASATSNGKLSSIDWSTFNNKISSGSNLGTTADGSIIFNDLSSTTLRFKRIKAGSNIIIIEETNDNKIGITSDPLFNTISSLGGLTAGGSANYTSFDSTGHQTMVGNAKPWRDEIGDALSLRQTGTGVSPNVLESTVDFNNASNLSDYLYMNVQLNHDKDLTSAIYPHIHWFQEYNAVPNFLIQYRWQRNLKSSVTGWTNLPCTSTATSFTGGTLHQICYSNSITAPSGSNLSDIVQFRIYRDNANSSGSFSGSDVYTGTVRILAFDVHFQINSLGSDGEYVK